jgi:23S rRNA pseudouridine1911/1915/1917 synthase
MTAAEPDADADAPPKRRPRDEGRAVVVPGTARGWRLDRFMAECFPRHSRRALMRVIKAGQVRVDGRPWRPGRLLEGGERLLFPPLDEAVRESAPEAGERTPRGVPVLHRDADLLVVSKPPGVPCHGGAGLGVTRTLLELLKDDVVAGFGLVHRVDKDTTGCVALVRGVERRAAAAAAFAKDDLVEKTYDALVQGVPDSPQGEIDLPLSDPGHGGKARVDARNGKPSLTRWAVVERFPGAARLRVVPVTGRTHQIRVHLAAIGFPLLVDPLYGRRSGWRLVDPKGGAPARLSRTPLHAASLVMPHPTTGERITVAAPLWPDHRRALEVLRVITAKDAARASGAAPVDAGAEAESGSHSDSDSDSEPE